MRIIKALLILILLCAPSLAAESCLPYVTPPPPKDAPPPPPKVTPTAFRPTVIDGTGPRLTFLGDSLTDGAGATAQEFSYPQQLAKMFPAGERAISVYALGGQPSGILQSIFQNVVVEADAVVIIWVGRNNYNEADGVVADVAAIVHHIQGHRFLLLGILPGLYAGEMPGRNGLAAINTLNERLRGLYPQSFLDVSPTLSCGDRVDGVHLNDAGQGKVATIVYQALNERGW